MEQSLQGIFPDLKNPWRVIKPCPRSRPQEAWWRQMTVGGDMRPPEGLGTVVPRWYAATCECGAPSPVRDAVVPLLPPESKSPCLLVSRVTKADRRPRKWRLINSRDDSGQPK